MQGGVGPRLKAGFVGRALVELLEGLGERGFGVLAGAERLLDLVRKGAEIVKPLGHDVQLL